MRVGSLFSGVAGFELGLQMARKDVEIVWQAELNSFARQVLGLRFPDAQLIPDVRGISARTPRVDLITAGFPCQPASAAGARKGTDDPRWLWPLVARALRILRPPLALIENVPGLLSRGMQDVIADLIALGYDAQWDVIPAAAVGAPHLRGRVWIVAYPRGQAVGRIFSAPPRIRTWSEEPFPRLLVRRPPRGMARQEALGNSLVPQVVAEIMAALARAKPPFRGEVTELKAIPAQAPRAGAIIQGQVVQLEPSVGPIRLRLWPTPKASYSGPDYGRSGRGGGGDDLVTAVARAHLWRTPNANVSKQADASRATAEGFWRDKHQINLQDQVAAKEGVSTGVLNPVWLEWLLGFPLGWTDLSR